MLQDDHYLPTNWSSTNCRKQDVRLMRLHKRNRQHFWRRSSVARAHKNSCRSRSTNTVDHFFQGGHSGLLKSSHQTHSSQILQKYIRVTRCTELAKKNKSTYAQCFCERGPMCSTKGMSVNCELQFRATVRPTCSRQSITLYSN